MRYILLALAIFSLTSCGFFGRSVKGNGNITQTTVNVNGFEGVDVSGSIKVIVRQDSITEVKIETDENLHEYVEISREGGILRISQRDNYNLKPTKSVTVYVAAPQLNSFEASGACEIVSSGMINSNKAVKVEMSGAFDGNLSITAPSVEADLSGAGQLSMTGTAKDVSIDGSGSSDLKFASMQAENLDISISGAGSAEVNATTRLIVKVSGAGTVRYRGNPQVEQKISGAGSVSRL